MGFQVNKVVEMAMEVGSGGHLIDRDKKKKIDKNETPLAKNPALPDRPYGERAASQAYGKILTGLERQGKNPSQLSQGVVMRELMQTLETVMDIESDHRSELEELAVSIVLDLPEFKDARSAYVAGELRIEASLVPEMPERMHQANMDRVEPSTEGGEELGMDIPEIGKELDQEVYKRQFINLLIQGAAVTKTHAYHLASSRLKEIHPELLQKYGLLVALGDLSYWMKPEDMFGGKHGGEAEIDVEQGDDGEGQFVIKATAINFPLLIQELVKALYEAVAYNLQSEDPGVRQHVYNRADTLKEEEWHIMHGPAVWMHFNHMVNKVNGGDFIPRIVNHIVSLSPGEFSSFMRGVLSETPESLTYLNNVVNAIKAEMEFEENEE